MTMEVDLMKLSEFVNSWNEGGLEIPDVDDTSLDWYGDVCRDNFRDVYTEREKRPLGVSQLYKPLGFLLLDKLDITNDEIITCKIKYHFLTGHFWEASILSLMYQHGVDIHSLQQEVHFCNLPGHIDCIYGDRRVVDIKTMSPYYFNSFVEDPDDDRGYLTQIACYQEALGIKYASILCLNKLTGELRLVNIEKGVEYAKDNVACTIESLKDRAHQVIEVYQEDVPLNGIVEEYLYPLVDTNFVEKIDGLFAPASIKYDSRRHAIWHLTQTNKLRRRYKIDTVYDNLSRLQK